MKIYRYAAALEPGDEPGVVIATFPDVPEAIAQGGGTGDVLAEAEDALGVALLSYPMRGLPLPAPAAVSSHMVGVAPDVAAKLALLEAFAASGLTKTELGRRLNKDEKEVRRMLDPMHATKLTPLADALHALGRRLVIGIEDVAA